MGKRRRQHGGGMFDRPGVLLTTTTLLLVSLWITFTATLQWHELLVGLIAVALTMIFFVSVLRTETLSFEVRLRDLLQIRHVPAAIAKDCWLVTLILLRDITGKERAGSFYRACGFRSSRRDPLLIGRGALAITYSSMSPNMIGIGIDPAQSLMVFHQLQRDEPSAMLHALGAAPHPGNER